MLKVDFPIDVLLENDRLLYQKLGFNPDIDKKLNSPFRKDRHPSFSFFKTKEGRILWKDFSTGEVGNVISFASKLYKVSNASSISVLSNFLRDYNITLTVVKSSYKKEIKPKEPATKLFKANYRNFLKYDLNYWNSYNITENILNFFNVRAVQQLYYKNQLTWINSKYCPIYEYDINYMDNVRYYRPFAPKNSKWLGNMKQYAIFGYKQLEKSDFIIITKSLKDVMFLYSLNIKAVSPSSETTIFNEREIQDIKKFSDNLIVLMDYDKTGIEAAEKYKQTYGFKNFFTLDEKAKDISDYFKFYGLTKTKNLIYDNNLLLQQLTEI
jgi:DNA primase